jgi:hypothetical protein
MDATPQYTSGTLQVVRELSEGGSRAMGEFPLILDHGENKFSSVLLSFELILL